MEKFVLGIYVLDTGKRKYRKVEMIFALLNVEEHSLLIVLRSLEMSIYGTGEFDLSNLSLQKQLPSVQTSQAPVPL